MSPRVAILGAFVGFVAVVGSNGVVGGTEVANDIGFGPATVGGGAGYGGFDGKQTCAEMVENVSCTDPCVMHLGMEEVSAREHSRLGCTSKWSWSKDDAFYCSIYVLFFFPYPSSFFSPKKLSLSASFRATFMMQVTLFEGTP